MCRNLESPANGNRSPNSDIVVSGSNMSFSCMEGYTLVGPSTTLCIDGSFDEDISGTTCGKLFVLFMFQN